jgi:hypothetical protein
VTGAVETNETQRAGTRNLADTQRRHSGEIGTHEPQQSPEPFMTEIVTTTLQRFFARNEQAANGARRTSATQRRAAPATRPDFAETRPVVFHSADAYAADFAELHGAI